MSISVKTLERLNEAVIDAIRALDEYVSVQRTIPDNMDTDVHLRKIQSSVRDAYEPFEKDIKGDIEDVKGKQNIYINDELRVLGEMEHWSYKAEADTERPYHELSTIMGQYDSDTKEYKALKKIQRAMVVIDGYIVDDLRNSIKEFKQIINKEEQND